MTDSAAILILGGTGMLGHTLFELLGRSEGLEVHSTARDVGPLLSRLSPQQRRRVHGSVDATDLGSVERVMAIVKPRTVVNCIGIVKQAPESADRIATIRTNALFPHELAKLCALVGARLVHFSTDCVYSGTRGGYRESDASDAVDLYGRTKWLGEPLEADALTIRTSIIGHELRGHRGLVEWFLAQKGKVQAFTKAVFSGLPTTEMARVLERYVLPRPELIGVFHLGSSTISKHDMLELVRKRYGVSTELVPQAEPRIDRSLDSSRFFGCTGYRAPGWPELVDSMFRDAAVRYPDRLRPEGNWLART